MWVNFPMLAPPPNCGLFPAWWILLFINGSPEFFIFVAQMIDLLALFARWHVVDHIPTTRNKQQKTKSNYQERKVQRLISFA